MRTHKAGRQVKRLAKSGTKNGFRLGNTAESAKDRTRIEVFALFSFMPVTTSIFTIILLFHFEAFSPILL
jgi:hypothetical protein